MSQRDSCRPALNLSTDVDLFSVISGWAQRVDGIQPLHSPHSKGGYLAASFDWTFGARFAYKDVTAHGGNPKEGDNNGNEESEENQQGAQGSEEARSNENPLNNPC
jgi:hypothetical protein